LSNRASSHTSDRVDHTIDALAEHLNMVAGPRVGALGAFGAFGRFVARICRRGTPRWRELQQILSHTRDAWELVEPVCRLDK
jgi:hypothetical protein